MSDGGDCDRDREPSYRKMTQIATDFSGEDVQIHTVAFSPGAETESLKQLAARAGACGRFHEARNRKDLNEAFANIAKNCDSAKDAIVRTLGKQISAEVTKKLMLDYL